MKEQGWTWGFLEGQVLERSQWFSLVDAFCTVEKDTDNFSDEFIDMYDED